MQEGSYRQPTLIPASCALNWMLQGLKLLATVGLWSSHLQQKNFNWDIINAQTFHYFAFAFDKQFLFLRDRPVLIIIALFNISTICSILQAFMCK